MDAIFGGENFRNEIIWKRTTTKNDYTQGATNWPRVHDVILNYGKNATLVKFRQPFAPLDGSYIQSHYKLTDESGRKYQLTDLTAPGSGMRGHPQYEFMGVTRFWRYNKEKMQRLAAEGRVIQPRPGAVPRYKRYLDEMKGVAITDIWTDIYPINSQAQERLRYPTQKPESLLARIVEASSDKGDVVLDPFCGCGTAIEVAQKYQRRWIGIDVTHLSLAIIKHRLERRFGQEVFKNIAVIGEPVNEDEALALARRDKFGFQCWAVGRLGAPPIDQKKGADRGIDGRIYFHDDLGFPKQIIISVKAGEHLGPQFVRELRGVVDRERAEMGILVLVKEPTVEMKREAAQLGTYKSLGGSFPRLQIITIRDIFANKPLNIPGRINPYERKGPSSVGAEARPAAQQLRLLP